MPGSLSKRKCRYRIGSSPLAFAVSTKLYKAALAVAPLGEPEKEPILPTDSKGADGVLSQIVIRQQDAVFKIRFQPAPTVPMRRRSHAREGF